MLYRICLLLLLLGCAAVSRAQINPFPSIEQGIERKQNLSVLRDSLTAIYPTCYQARQYLSAGRCLIDLLRITDLRTQDSLYFKNSALFDSLLATEKDSSFLGILHFVMARRIHTFLLREQWSRYKRISFLRKDIPINYAALSDDSLQTIVARHDSMARKLTEQVVLSQPEDIRWLSSGFRDILFTPTLYDIIIYQQIILQPAVLPDGWANHKSQLLSLPNEEFAALLDTVTVPGPMKLFALWRQHHKGLSPEACRFIETSAGIYLYNTPRYAPAADSIRPAFENWLVKNTAAPYPSTKAISVYHLYNLWRELGSKYRKNNYSGQESLLRRKEDLYAPEYRYYYLKAAGLLQQHAALLDSFSFLKNEMELMQRAFSFPVARVNMKRHALPGTLILASLGWANLSQVSMKIIKLNAPVANSYHYLPDSVASSMPAVATRQFKLGNMASDFQYHNTFLKIDPLPAGRYLLIITGTGSEGKEQIFDRLEFTVTRIAIVHDDRKIFVLNRETGMPISNASVIVYKKEYLSSRGGWVTGKRITPRLNPQGYFTMPNWDNAWVMVVNKTDTADSDLEIEEDDNSESGIYDKEEYDNLIDYYDDHSKVYFFTDRAIYRPGQQVHFKALLFTTNPHTGEPILFNRHNIPVPLLQRLFNRDIKKNLLKDRISIQLENPFGRVADSLRLMINEYGSVAGSFRLPENAATGEWNLSVGDEEPEFRDEGYGSSHFRVEAYTRPQFDVSIQLPEKILLPGDSFHFSARVNSLAGVPLKDVNIRYRLVKWSSYSVEGGIAKYNSPHTTETVLQNSNGYSNEKGELLIPVNDSTVVHKQADGTELFDTWYSLELSATDASGETHDARASVSVSDKEIDVYLRHEKYADVNNTVALTINTRINGSNQRPGNCPVRLQFFKKYDYPQPPFLNPFMPADTIIYPGHFLQKWFPDIAFDEPSDSFMKSREVLVWDTVINCSGTGKFLIAPGKLPPSGYTIKASCVYKDRLLGAAESDLTLYNLAANISPGEEWNHTSERYTSPGNKIYYRSNFPYGYRFIIYQLKYFSKGEKAVHQKTEYHYRYAAPGISNFEYEVPADCIDKLQVTELYIYKNKLYSDDAEFNIAPAFDQNPEIIVEKFRSALSPGQKETFIVSVKTKNENTAAELLTTLYDASLDKLERHDWPYPSPGTRRWLNQNWTTRINPDAVHVMDRNDELLQMPPVINPSAEQPLWWVNPLDYADNENMGFAKRSYTGVSSALAGRVAGMQLRSLPLIQEVVVTTALSLPPKASINAITLRGNTGLGGEPGALIVLDGEIFTGDPSSINTKLVTDIMVLKAAAATDIYGARGANGVILISTKGPIKLPATPPAQQPRRNFNETAFFFPQLHADANGYYSFSFTMPESVTSWNWKMMAHTKDLRFATKEMKLQTNLPLMVQPHLPRVIYQGDRINLQSRISNLDSLLLAGTISCRIEDMVTGEDITHQLTPAAEKNFRVAPGSNSNEGFVLQIPENQLNPLRITISARSGSTADAEEHVLPVLSKKILSVATTPFRLQQSGDSSISAPSLPADASPYGIGITIRPVARLSWLHALQYLSGYPFNCAEQVCSKLIGHLAANEALRSDSIFRAAAQALKKTDTGHSTQLIPETLPALAVPWLTLTEKNQTGRRQSLILFNEEMNNEKIRNYLDELMSLQNADGGMPWFKNGESDRWISYYVLQALGSASYQKILIPPAARLNNFDRFITNLTHYCDNHFADANTNIADTVQFLAARAYWQNAYPLPFGKNRLDSIFTRCRNLERMLGPVTKNALAIASLQFYRPADEPWQQARRSLQSLKEEAINDETDGIRWKSLFRDDELSYGGEETMAAFLDAFNLAGMGAEMNPGVLKWLLRNADNSNYRTTKSAAAFARVCLYPGTPADAPQQVEAVWADHRLNVSGALAGGNDIAFAGQATLLPEKILLHKTTVGIASGNLLYYYFSSNPAANTASTGLSVSRSYFKWNKNTQQWDSLTAAMPVTTGDRLRTTITLNSIRKLGYVLITDKMAACQELPEYKSGYAYGDHISYYQSGYDDGMRFFAREVPLGYSSFSYETLITQQGTFYCGRTEAEGMYNPEIKVYGTGMALEVK